VRLLLASTSKTRAGLLRGAGVAFDAEAAAIDETGISAALLADGASPADVAQSLAEQKAVKVSARHPGRMVLGADQTLGLKDVLYHKPQDLAEAASHLRQLRGQTHHLFTAAVIARDGIPVWRHTARAELTMRPFSDEFLTHYLKETGPAACDGPGAYQVEGLGAQLFSRIDGDHTVILGLPLLPLLDFLRMQGMLPS